jgi:hypothetical protein
VVEVAGIEPVAGPLESTNYSRLTHYRPPNPASEYPWGVEKTGIHNPRIQLFHPHCKKSSIGISVYGRGFVKTGFEDN